MMIKIINLFFLINENISVNNDDESGGNLSPI